MRLKIKFGPNKTNVNRNSQLIVSWLSKVLGINKFHDEKDKSYSISEMFGGYKNEDGTKTYPKGGSIYISSDNIEFIKAIHKNAYNVPYSGGMEVLSISQSMDEIYLNDELNYMSTSLNGIFLYKRNEKGATREWTVFRDENWLDDLNTQTKRKLLRINPELNLDDFIIQISESENNKMVSVDFKDFWLHTSRLTLRVYGSVETKKMLMTYGLGNLNGCGFGFIYPTEQSIEYR